MPVAMPLAPAATSDQLGDMELHMAGPGGYMLELTVADGAAIDSELAMLLSDPVTKRAAGRLLRVLDDIARRGAGAETENVHLPSSTPKLHAVRVGNCAAFYAYATAGGRTAMFLLGFWPARIHLRKVGTAAARLASLP